MPLTGTLVADFASFQQACADSETRLKGFESGAAKVEKQLQTMTDSLQGNKLVAQATIAAEAVERIGGISKLTEAELARLGPVAQEAADKLKRMGTDVPPGIQKIADAAKGVGDGFAEWSGKFDIKKAIEDPIGSAKGGVLAFAETLGPTGTALVGLVTVGAALGAELIHLGTDAELIGASIGRMGTQFNIPVGAVSDLRFAVLAAGGDFSTFGDSMFTFQKRIEDNGDAVEKGLGKIGLSLNTIKALRPDEQFLAISDAIRATGSETNKSAVAFEIFGRQGKDILPLLMKDLSGLSEEAEKLGATWSETDVKAARAFRAEVTLMAAQTEEAWTSLGRTVAPVTNELVVGWDRMKLAVANVANITIGTFPKVADEIRHLTGSTGDLEIKTAELAAVQDTVNHLFAQASKEGLDHDAATQQVASSMLALGYNLKTVETATGLTKEAVRALAGELKGAKIEAEAFGASWDRIAKLEAEGVASTEGLSASTRGLVLHYQELGAKVEDITAQTGASAAQQRLLSAEHATGTEAAKKYTAAWAELNSIGGTWRDTVAGLDPVMVKQITYYLDAGAAQSTLAEAFHRSAGEVKAIAEGLKEYGEILKKIKDVEKDRTDAAGVGLLGLSKTEQETSQKRFEADAHANGEIIKARADLNDEIAKSSLDSASYQINKIWVVADAQVAAFKGTDEQRAQYAALVYAHAADDASKIEYLASTTLKNITDEGIDAMLALLKEEQDVIDKAAAKAAAAKTKAQNQTYSVSSAYSTGDLAAMAAAQGGQVAKDYYGNPYVYIPGVNAAPSNHFAEGVQNFAGGLAMVGEHGPELVNLPSGSDVLSNQASMQFVEALKATGVTAVAAAAEAARLNGDVTALRMATARANRNAQLGISGLASDLDALKATQLALAVAQGAIAAPTNDAQAWPTVSLPATAGGGAITITNTFYVNGTAADVARQVADQIMRTVKQAQQVGR